jgi:hypothetical protein
MQGHVYHWRHGWIPLSHYAALQKAHGSHAGAAKFLNESNGVHGTQSPNRHILEKIPASDHGLSAKGIHVGDSVHARQPGLDAVTTGKLVSVSPHGHAVIEYKDRHGNAVQGTFNPSHVAKAGESLRHTPDSRESNGAPAIHTHGTKEVSTAAHVANLKVGDTAHVKGESATVPGVADSVRGTVTSISTQVKTKRGASTGERVHVVEVRHTPADGSMPRSRAIVVPTGETMHKTAHGWTPG